MGQAVYTNLRYHPNWQNARSARTIMRSAGVTAAGKDAVGAAGQQPLHLQCFINSGIEGDGVDHKNHLRGKFPSPV